MNDLLEGPEDGQGERKTDEGDRDQGPEHEVVELHDGLWSIQVLADQGAKERDGHIAEKPAAAPGLRRQQPSIASSTRQGLGDFFAERGRSEE